MMTGASSGPTLLTKKGMPMHDSQDRTTVVRPVGEWVEVSEPLTGSVSGAVVALSFVFEKHDEMWTGRCTELGTATYGRARDYVRTKLTHLVQLYLNVLERTEQRERVCREQGVVVHVQPLSDLAMELNPPQGLEYRQWFCAEVQAA
jgi:hypothetical protein